jgi:hypothetical protein
LELVRIGHDGKGLGAGWYLDEVTVEVPSRGELMVFPCHRWLAEDEDDGKIERELYPSQQNNIEQSKKNLISVDICVNFFKLERVYLCRDSV